MLGQSFDQTFKMINRFQIVFVLSALLLHAVALGQTSVDSLLRLIESERIDSIKLRHYMELIPAERKRDVESALVYGRHALELAEKIDKDELILQVRLLNANSLRAKGEHGQTEAALKTLLQDAKEAKNIRVIAGCQQSLSRVSEMQGNYAEGIRLGWLAAVEFKKLRDTTEWISSINNTGNNFLGFGNIDSAMWCYNLCLHLATASGNSYLQANALGNLALVYYRLDDIPKALDITQQSALLHRKIGQKEALGTDLSNIAFYYQFIPAKKDSVIPYLKMAAVLYEEVGNKSAMAAIFNSLGVQYNTKGDNLKALEYHRKALNLSRITQNRLEEARTLSSIGHDHKNLNDSDSAFFYLREGMTMAKEMFNSHLILQLYESYVSFNKHFGNFEKALFYSERKEVFRDSLYGIEKLKVLEELTTKYETEKKDQENQILKLRVEKRNRTILGIATGLTLSLIVLVLLVVNNTSQKKKHAAETEALKNEIELFKVRRQEATVDVIPNDDFLELDRLNFGLQEELDELDMEVIRVWFDDIALSRKEVADRLCISEDGLKSRIRKVYRKLRVSSKQEAIKKILQISRISLAS